jgi:hypothetical protein
MFFGRIVRVRTLSTLIVRSRMMKPFYGHLICIFRATLGLSLLHAIDRGVGAQLRRKRRLEDWASTGTYSPSPLSPRASFIG